MGISKTELKGFAIHALAALLVSASMVYAAAFDVDLGLGATENAAYRGSGAGLDGYETGKSAETTHLLTFHNDTDYTLSFSLQSSNCMEEVGHDAFSIPPRESHHLSVVDKNSGSRCLNEDKDVQWSVSRLTADGGRWGDDYWIRFEHSRTPWLEYAPWGSDVIAPSVSGSGVPTSAYCYDGHTPLYCLLQWANTEGGRVEIYFSQ